LTPTVTSHAIAQDIDAIILLATTILSGQSKAFANVS